MYGALLDEKLSDKELISRILLGEKELYAIIVRRYNQRIYRVGISIINDEAEVEDIMQVTYIRAYENLARFAFAASFSTWLTRILINECLLRKKMRKKSIMLTEADHNDHSIQSGIEHKGPESQLLNAELKNLLELSIRQLPEKYRTVFVLRMIENMNVAETKECLNISEVNVKVRLNRAKALLKKSLIPYCGSHELLHFHLNRCDRMAVYVMSRIRGMDLPNSNDKGIPTLFG